MFNHLYIQHVLKESIERVLEVLKENNQSMSQLDTLNVEIVQNVSYIYSKC